jgi:hypothetical protein
MGQSACEILVRLNDAHLNGSRHLFRHVVVNGTLVRSSEKLWARPGEPNLCRAVSLQTVIEDEQLLRGESSKSSHDSEKGTQRGDPVRSLRTEVDEQKERPKRSTIGRIEALHVIHLPCLAEPHPFTLAYTCTS